MKLISQEAINGKLLRAIASRRQLEEVMVDFWYNHFNVFVNKGQPTRIWVGSYEETAIRPYILGRFRDLLGATARHPAMLFYLDNWQNTDPNSKGARGRFKGLNENYARELMELHTLGVDGGYTQDDVVALARILTGWGLIRRRRGQDSSGFIFQGDRHDYGDKVFLGTTIKGTGMDEVEQALDILASHPSTARYISFKLAQYFVADVGNTTPRILQGTMPVAHLPVRKQATRPMALDRPRIHAAFDRLYGGNDPLSLAYQEGDEARRIILEELNTEMMNANRGAASPGNFAKDASKLAQLMVGDGRTQLGFMALGGWDTHVNQTNQLNRNLKSLAAGLKALTGGLGNLYQHTAIAVISEFGRTVAENGNGGTDHGHGNVMWVLGGSVRGGKVYGQWPGLEKEELFEGRDLAVTTDFRDAIASLLVQHLQISSADLREIFPGYVPQNNLRLLA